MSEPTPGTDRHGVISRLGSLVIHALPHQFLVIVLLNVMMLGAMFWFISVRAEHSMSIMNQLLASCLEGRK